MSSPPEPTAASTHGAFLALLGHELRNPLGPVRNAVHILRGREGLDAQALWALDLIERQLDELVTIIETVSELSRISRGAARSTRAPFAVGRVVEAAAEASRAMFAQKGQGCTVALSTGDAQAEGDHERAARAVQALLRCTSKSLATGATIEVRAAIDGDRWTVGVGPPAMRQAAPRESSDEMAPQGSIDLTLVRALAELMGGRLAVYSAHGDDVRYELELPLRAP
jgi:signal transduction histidine kinase